jgi:hypothetical protein
MRGNMSGGARTLKSGKVCYSSRGTTDVITVTLGHTAGKQRIDMRPQNMGATAAPRAQGAR